MKLYSLLNEILIDERISFEIDFSLRKNLMQDHLVQYFNQ